MSKGTLYLVATPIGNLKDITFRAVEVLKEVDLIAAEDTRRTLTLLNALSIKNKLISYHEHSSKAREQELMQMLLDGKNIAVVTDAGSPIISDPGAGIAAAAIQNEVTVTAIPGPCALICALSVSGISAEKFIFEGFLPKDNSRQAALDKIASHTMTTVFYESPHQLKNTLKELSKRIPKRKIAVVKELTKVHETILRMTVEEAEQALREEEIRGEYVLVLEAGEEEQQQEASEEEIQRYLEGLLEEGKSKKDAVKETAEALNVNKNRVYKIMLQI